MVSSAASLRPEYGRSAGARQVPWLR